MNKNMISKALAGSLLVAASMSANATTTPITVTFDVLPALTITTTTAFAPGAVLTGAAGTTCTWTPTLGGAPTATTGAVGDVTATRSGDGCPALASSAGAATNTGVYLVTAGATAPNVDVQVTVSTATSLDTNLTFAPTAAATPDDGSSAVVALAADTAAAVNTGANGIIVLYLGGTTTAVNAVAASTDVTFDVVAVY